MAKKRRRRRPSLLTKGINIGVLLLAFSRPLAIIFGGGDIGRKLAIISSEATGGLAGTNRTFSTDAALAFYGPMGAAIILKKAISMVRKAARI